LYNQPVSNQLVEKHRSYTVRIRLMKIKSSYITAAVVAVAVVAVGAVAYVLVKNGSKTTLNDQPNGPEGSEAGLTIQVMGHTSDPGGLWLRGSGFTPNGEYYTEVYYPLDSPQKGAEYTFIRDGRADANGATPGWRWDPAVTDTGEPDPPGEYRLTMHDNQTGRKVSTTFNITKP
jgi:hypothetical protein